MNKIAFWQLCLPILGFKEMEPIKRTSRLRYSRIKPANLKRRKIRGQLCLRIPDILVSVAVPTHGTRSVCTPPSADNTDLLADYARTGDRRVRDRIVSQNLGLIQNIALEFHRKTNQPCEDLSQVGAIGFLKAIDAFSPTKGVKFSTFAYHYVQGEIKHWLRDRASAIRPCRRWYYMINTEKRVRRELGAIASNEAVRKKLGLSLKDWQEFQLFKETRKMVALDMRCGESGDTLGELIADSRSPETTSLELSLLMERLEPEYRQAIAMLNLQELSQKEASARVGCKPKEIALRAREGLQRLEAIAASS